LELSKYFRKFVLEFKIITNKGIAMLLETVSENLYLPIIDTYLNNDLEHFQSECLKDKKTFKFLKDKKTFKFLKDVPKFRLLNDKILNSELEFVDIFENNYESFEPELIETLNVYFISEFIRCINDNFDNIIINNNINTELNKPSEYNFRTDKTLIDLELEDSKLNLLFDFFESEIINKQSINLSKHLKDNYTSYDGFMSFTSNNIDDFFESAKEFKIEFELMLGIIFHHLNNENNIELIDSNIRTLQNSFDEYVYNEIYQSKFDTIKDEFYYSDSEIELQIKINKALENQLVIF